MTEKSKGIKLTDKGKKMVESIIVPSIEPLWYCEIRGLKDDL